MIPIIAMIDGYDLFLTKILFTIRKTYCANLIA